MSKEQSTNCKRIQLQLRDDAKMLNKYDMFFASADIHSQPVATIMKIEVGTINSSILSIKFEYVICITYFL